MPAWVLRVRMTSPRSMVPSAFLSRLAGLSCPAVQVRYQGPEVGVVLFEGGDPVLQVAECGLGGGQPFRVGSGSCRAVGVADEERAALLRYDELVLAQFLQ